MSAKSPSQNPLLGDDRLPPFSRIRPEHAEPAVDALLAEAREIVRSVLESPPPRTWDSLAAPLEACSDRLDRAWSAVRHLHSVADSPALREAYNACLPKLSDHATWLGQHHELYEAYRSLAASPAFGDLDEGQCKIVDNALRDFKLAGVELEAGDRERLRAISSRLSELSSQFGEHVLDATQAWKKPIDDEAVLAGLPPTALALAADMAKREGHEGWLFGLEFPSYFPLITYADDEALRREAYEAYTTRASERGPHDGRLDNGPLMDEILGLRAEQARLLGFASYAELSLARKMAPSTERVLEFLDDLAVRSRPMAERERAELETFAREQHGRERLEAWDLAYYAEKLRVHRFSLSQEELRPYFPAPRVLSGLFEVVKRLFGLEVQSSAEAETWHPDVQFFRINEPDGSLRGELYLDLYARPDKRGGAWMDECRVRRRTDSGLQTPVAFLTCNFTRPVGGAPALLTHDEVTTLFHEFGHGLHHLLTRVEHAGVSGINGVEWDAVELPSQLLENWCWEREALALISGHHESGEPLPDALYERLRSARTFQSGMQMLRQLEFALFDFRIHLEYSPGSPGQIESILDDVRRRVAVVIPPEFNRFAHAFSHIFAGGYAAGYYSYKWAEALSSDAFSRFEEEGIFNRETGARLLHALLERGGTRKAMDLFVAFRGREPRIDALLRHAGIEPEPAHATGSTP